VALNLGFLPDTDVIDIKAHRPLAAATGAVEITMPVAIVAAAYIIGQGFVDAFGD